VRVLRLIAVVAGVGALLAVAPGIGSSSSGQSRVAQQECGRVEFVSQLEAVFGRFKTLPQANAYRAKVIAAGFANAEVFPDCPSGYKVSLRGFESFDTAVTLQDEARRANYFPTIECIQGKDDVGELEAVFGHRPTRSEASDLATRMAALGFTGAQLESDPCGGFEVMIKGFTDRSQADAFVAEARAVGFDVTIENS
jgi:cell division septation protein DedD